MSLTETIVFLHGAGVGPESWTPQLETLPDRIMGFAPPLPGLDAPQFSLQRSADSLRALLDARGIEQAHLCGLSLGAMVATRFAVDHPERCASLVLCAGQVRPPRLLMRIQSAVIGVLPQRLAAPPGMSKAQLHHILDAVSGTDFTAELLELDLPALVLCGSRDRANLPAARELASLITRARLEIIPGAGHQANRDKPEAFNRVLRDFLPD